jgi:hypothetical protein
LGLHGKVVYGEETKEKERECVKKGMEAAVNK